MMMDQDRVDSFHRLYYDRRCWEATRWMGVPCQKCPMDLWAYQEIVFETRPTLILETGTAAGGSALFLRDMMGLAGQGGAVLSVDIEPNPNRPSHPDIEYLLGDSAGEAALRRIRERLERSRPKPVVMAVLDSDHHKEHVLKELDLYAPWVSPGCYLVVEDTNVNGHPAFPEHGPGPMEALEEWLPDHPEFEVDRTREKHLMTLYPKGFLRKRLS